MIATPHTHVPASAENETGAVPLAARDTHAAGAQCHAVTRPSASAAHSEWRSALNASAVMAARCGDGPLAGAQ